MNNREMARGVFFFTVYLLGATLALGGAGLVCLMSGQAFMEWGDCRVIGYLFVGTGIGLAVAGIHRLSSLAGKRDTP